MPWLNVGSKKSTGTILEVVRALHMAFRKQFIEIINRISKEMIFHVKNFPPHICALNGKTGFEGDDQSVEKERKKEAKRIFGNIEEDLFQRPRAEITPILQHFQDVLTGKVSFYQIPKSQEDFKYYEDSLECTNIRGRPQGAKNKKNKNKREPSRFEIIESKSKRRGRPPSKVTSKTTSRSQSNFPSPIMEVDPSENSEDFEASLSESISSSD
ncbi:hypothetical protein O181_110100 [Austropuccinia psidii MF-1]|uniref:Uncharacterized protein n=1 Tax=Austropuccinia psidii MF-1 TaxID=1389203 RepID=A0A9Q3JZR0_9BASI|nr:hypothetical protein [Austropuccinia psidii MF-1]